VQFSFFRHSPGARRARSDAVRADGAIVTTVSG